MTTERQYTGPRRQGYGCDCASSQHKKEHPRGGRSQSRRGWVPI